MNDALAQIRQLERELGAVLYNSQRRVQEREPALEIEHLRYGNLLYQFFTSAKREPEAVNGELPGTATIAAVHHDSKDSGKHSQIQQDLPCCRAKSPVKEVKIFHPGISFFYHNVEQLHTAGETSESGAVSKEPTRAGALVSPGLEDP